MNPWSAYVKSMALESDRLIHVGNMQLVDFYGRVEDEYAALGKGVGLVDRAYRCTLEVTGKDRASWLHNLTTNQIKTLGRGEGVYAFALNIQGRILFDLVVMVCDDSIRLDVDRRFLDDVVKHFNKYIITEDVRLVDRSDEFQCFALAGEQAADKLSTMGMPQASTMALFSSGTLSWQGFSLHVCRSGFCGLRAFELWVPSEKTVALWEALRDEVQGTRVVMPVGHRAVTSRRIEGGIAWPGLEITDEYLPAETGQFDRAVSMNKGCYLGQEVVERMRSRGVVARRLIGLKIDSDDVPICGAIIVDKDGQVIGTLTSACHSIGFGQVIGLGYVKTQAYDAGKSATIMENSHAFEAKMVELPFIR